MLLLEIYHYPGKNEAKLLMPVFANFLTCYLFYGTRV
jgi:hypothetical protein